jgi:uroporphyrinogen decarboxylase
MSMKPLLQLFAHQTVPDVPPIWLMRQAGRYLPEYRATRETAGGFLNLCYTPELAEEVTLQPIRRYAFDASILFADILLIPQALGQKLWFETGEGPRLEPIVSADGLDASDVMRTLAPVAQTVARLSKSLPSETTLIGFAGAPWTVATYMVAGRGTPDQAPARDLALSNPNDFQAIIDVLVAATIDYLSAQIEAGAEVVQLFESWAGSLRGAEFERWCIEPVAEIISGLRARGYQQPVIGFPRAADYDMGVYVERTKCQALGLDTFANRQEIMRQVPEDIILQGNLDPLVLVEGGDVLDQAIDEIIDDFAGRRFIFNLGHGIVPHTPPNHVEQLVQRIRKIK